MNYAKALAMSGATLVAAVAIGTAASPVRAQSAGPLLVVSHPDDYVTRHISYADLNLAVVPGELTLKRRVGAAVTEVCDETVGNSTNTSFDYRECATEAWRGARPQVALAVERAHELAATGSSSLAATAITVSIPQ